MNRGRDDGCNCSALMKLARLGLVVSSVAGCSGGEARSVGGLLESRRVSLDQAEQLPFQCEGALLRAPALHFEHLAKSVTLYTCHSASEETVLLTDHFVDEAGQEVDLAALRADDFEAWKANDGLMDADLRAEFANGKPSVTADVWFGLPLELLEHNKEEYLAGPSSDDPSTWLAFADSSLRMAAERMIERIVRLVPDAQILPYPGGMAPYVKVVADEQTLYSISSLEDVAAIGLAYDPDNDTPQCEAYYDLDRIPWFFASGRTGDGAGVGVADILGTAWHCGCRRHYSLGSCRWFL
jgi:hypothetical protein